jgi:hypothetical protein
MDNARTYTHPLSGVVHAGDGSRAQVEGSTGNRALICAVWVLALLLGVAVVGGCGVAFSFYGASRPAREAIEPAKSTVEYEPLSKVNDGSYAEEQGGGKSRSLGVLRRLRSRQ